MSRATSRRSFCSAICAMVLSASASRYSASSFCCSILSTVSISSPGSVGTAYQILMSLCYIALSVRLVQLIMAFRGGSADGPLTGRRPPARFIARRTGASTSLQAGEIGPPGSPGTARYGRRRAPRRRKASGRRRRRRSQHEQFFARPHRRSTITAGAAAAAAGAATGAAVAAAASAPRLPGPRHRPWRRQRAFSQPAESFDLFFSGIAVRARRRSARRRRLFG